MKGTQDRQSLDASLERLGTKYPKANKLAVQGWHMVYPEASIDELMEKSHNDNITLVKSSINELLEKKEGQAEEGHSFR